MARHWVDAYSVLHDKTIKVPINFIAYINASNGMAAGNTLEEALIQAACEVFERHTQIQIIKPEKSVPSIDKGTVENSRLKSMISFYENENVEIILNDLSMDGRFPSIGVLFINHNLRPGRLEHKILVPGVSFNMDEALSRCLTEIMQGRNTLKVPSPAFDKPVSPSSRVENLYLLFKCCVSQKDISFLEKGDIVAYRASRSEDIFTEIEAIKNVCQALETDFFVVDLTHPVLKFPVARVVLPGVSDFLPFVYEDILTSINTNPDSTWHGEHYKSVMDSFFNACL
jgi:YcaO-like protein with predicted kinase domain